MASLNKVLLIGNLGRDPESRTFPNGGTVTNVSIATTDRWKDRQTGEQREATEWHNLVFHNRLAEIAAQYLRKGSPVYVEGSLRTRKWQDKNGQDRYTTEIHVNEMQMLGSKGDGARAQGGQYDSSAQYAAPSAPAARPDSAPQQNVPPQPASDGFDNFEDDVPF
ncbi:MAG: single-stranded DNA-binding protein [Rhodocyclaceae bacterium]|nr:single-stranded DNA-binding protein [Rhodocyclaceae bacterium]